MNVKLNGIVDSLTPVGISQLGSLIFDNVVFPAGSWLDNNLNRQEYNEVKLDAVKLRISRAKEFVESQISGISGTITEYVSHKDYIIELSAIIAPFPLSATQAAQTAAGLLPGVSEITGAVGGTAVAESSQLLSDISDLGDSPDRVEIRSKILQNYHKITHVVIKEVSRSKVSADSWQVNMTLKSSFEIDLGDFG